MPARWFVVVFLLTSLVVGILEGNSARAFVGKNRAWIEGAIYAVLWSPITMIGSWIVAKVAYALFGPVHVVESDNSVYCPCGYNLTGNTTGRCPECGYLTDNPPAPS